MAARTEGITDVSIMDLCLGAARSPRVTHEVEVDEDGVEDVTAVREGQCAATNRSAADEGGELGRPASSVLDASSRARLLQPAR
jgi:hypothetical protein